MGLDQRSCVAASTKAQREVDGDGPGQIGVVQLLGRGKVTEASCFLSALSLGCANGTFSWRARFLTHSSCHCWTADVVLQLTVTLPRLLKDL